MRIGIDLGGMSIKAGLVDENLKIIYKETAPTNVNSDAECIVRDIVALIHSVMEKNPNCNVDAIGIGVPGYVDKQQMVKNCNNIPLENLDLRGKLSAEFGVSVSVDNDANVAALGEVLAGAAKQYSDAVMITVGTGVGCGIVLNNRVYRGCNGAAGEIGHKVIVADGIPCNCGRRGCYEKYASATALIEATKEAMQEHPESIMWKICDGSLDNANGKTAFDAWRANDEVGTAVVEKFISYLAVGIIDIVNLLQPEAIILGGGISKEGDTLLNMIRPKLIAERYSKEGVQTELFIAELGNDAGIIGASQL